MDNVLFIVLMIVLLLFAPTCAAIYIYYQKSQMTTEEWAQSIVEQEERLKEAQKNPMYWSMYM